MQLSNLVIVGFLKHHVYKKPGYGNRVRGLQKPDFLS